MKQLQKPNNHTSAYRAAQQAADEGLLNESPEAIARRKKIRDSLEGFDVYMFDSFVKNMYPKSEEELRELKKEKINSLFGCIFMFAVAPALIIAGLYGVSVLRDSIHGENAENGGATHSSITPW